MKTWSSIACAVVFAVFSAVSSAQNPIKIGMSMPQTGSLGAGGKAALLPLQMWVEDVNAKGGLLGRKGDFIVYDDPTNPALTPHLYPKLLPTDTLNHITPPPTPPPPPP